MFTITIAQFCTNQQIAKLHLKRLRLSDLVYCANPHNLPNIARGIFWFSAFIVIHKNASVSNWIHHNL